MWIGPADVPGGHEEASVRYRAGAFFLIDAVFGSRASVRIAPGQFLA